jgi:hypothetical protein
VLQSFVKTSPRLFQRYEDFGISGQSSSLKATGYKGYNLSIYASGFQPYLTGGLFRIKNGGTPKQGYFYKLDKNVLLDVKNKL